MVKVQFIESDVVALLKRIQVKTIYADGVLLVDDEEAEHTELTELIYNNATAQCVDAIYGTKEDYLAAINLNDDRLVMEIERHGLKDFKNGVEYRPFEFINVYESDVYEVNEEAKAKYDALQEQYLMDSCLRQMI